MLVRCLRSRKECKRMRRENAKLLVSEFPADVLRTHMQDVADYLVCREGLWWSKEGNYLLFHDGDDEPCFRDEGPPFRSFVDTKIYEILVAAKHP